jgi:type IV pilus assembly protein PilQ
VVGIIACATPQGASDDKMSPGSASVVSQELSALEVDNVDGDTVITLVGLEPPAYHDYRNDGDGLIVLELPGVSRSPDGMLGAIAGEGHQLAVYDDLVDHVTTSTHEGDGMSITRIEISLARSADFDMLRTNDGLAIRVREASDLAASQGADGTVSADVAGSDPWSSAEALDGESPDGGPDAISAQVEAVLATTLLDVGIKETDAGVLVQLRSDGRIVTAESFTLEDPDRLVVDLPGLTSEIVQKRIELGSPWVSAVRIGSHPDKVRIVIDGGAASAGFMGRKVIPASDGLYLTVGSGEDLERALAQSLSYATATAEVVADAFETMSEAESFDESEAFIAEEEIIGSLDDALAEDPWAIGEEDEVELVSAYEVEEVVAEELAEEVVELDAGAAEIFGLQYDRNDDRDRIAVLSDRLVEYEVLYPDSKTAVISILDATITDEAAQRILPEPGGPVSLVTTFQQPDLETSQVRVVMTRSAGVEAVLTRRGSLLFIDFENTGVPAATPPAYVPGESTAVAYGSGESMPAAMSAEGLEDEMAPMADSASAAVSDSVAAGLDNEQEEPNTALPEFDDPEAMVALGEAASSEDDWGQPMADMADSTESAPAALEPPAAVEILAEGGLIDGKQYVGRRISLDFKDVQVSDVLRLIAEVSDLNIIAGDEVAGRITIRLVDVPWDQALDVILLTKGLGFVRVGNVLRIAPSEVLKVEEEVRLQERRNKEKLEDLEVKLQPVNYASVNDVQKLIRRLLSPRGTVNTDERTNTIIIKDIPSVIDEATALIMAIDTQTPQVMIEAKIVEAALSFGRELGSSWAVGTQPWVDAFAPGSNPRNDLGNQDFRFAGENNVIFGNPITSTATGALNFGGFLLDDKMAVEVHIEAMEATGEGKVISSPRIVTLDNREAIIEQGVSIPFQTFEGGDAKLEFIDAVLSLKVTPHITSDKSIIMQLEVTRNAPDESVPTPTGSPAIAKNQAKTETLVKDGQTLVIGGIYTVDKTERSSRVPYLHRIPVLGAAFKSKEVSDIRKELLIFVTPRIVVNPALALN